MICVPWKQKHKKNENPILLSYVNSVLKIGFYHSFLASQAKFYDEILNANVKVENSLLLLLLLFYIFHDS